MCNISIHRWHYHEINLKGFVIAKGGNKVAYHDWVIIHCVFEDDAVRISSVKRSRTMSITIVRSLPSKKIYIQASALYASQFFTIRSSPSQGSLVDCASDLKCTSLAWAPWPVQYHLLLFKVLKLLFRCCSGNSKRDLLVQGWYCIHFNGQIIWRFFNVALVSKQLLKFI